MHIRQATLGDAAALAAIYNHYIHQTIITFETDAVDAQEMATRIQEKLAHHDWLVGEVDGVIVGYAYYGTFRPRRAYAHSVESTVYLDPAHTGQGYGYQLYTHLLASARARAYRELIGVIALPNPASLRLHARVGFHEVGVLQRVGHKLGRYVDVAIWQKSLDT